MENLLSWPSLAIIAVALALLLIILRAFGRVRFTVRFKEAVSVSPWSQQPCPHLGLLDDPFAHKDEPDEEHRCYLWMQRDRIDLTHQKSFCLSSAHDYCPWLSIAPPEGKAPAARRVPQTIVGTAGSSLGAVANVVSALVAELVFMISRALIVTKRRIDVTLPFAGALIEFLGEKIGIGGRVALRVMSRVSGKAGAKAYIGLRWFVAVSARKSGALARLAWARRPKPFARRSQTKAAVPAGVISSSSDAASGLPLSPAPVSVISGPTVPGLQFPQAKGSLSHAEDLFQQGKAAGMSGNRKLAHSFFSLVADLEPYNDEAWLWKGAMTDDAAEKLSCLQRALAINPTNERAQQAIQQLGEGHGDAAAPFRSSEAVGAGKRKSTSRSKLSAAASEDAMIHGALDALERGDDDRAYRILVSATEMNPLNEKAWFWRAKASPTLDELIFCLQQALTIDPDNEKVRANLLWAIQRQQKEVVAARTALAANRVEARVVPHGRRYGRIAAGGLRVLAGMVCLVLAAYWVIAAVSPLFELSGVKSVSDLLQGAGEANLQRASFFEGILSQWLPELTWVSVPGYEKLEIASGYNLLVAVPYTIGFLYLFVAVGALKRESWSRAWGIVVTALGLAMMVLFSTNGDATLLLSAMGLVTILLLFAGFSRLSRETG